MHQKQREEALSRKGSRKVRESSETQGSLSSSAWGVISPAPAHMHQNLLPRVLPRVRGKPLIGVSQH